MKRKLLFISLIMVLVTLPLAACAQPAPAPAPTPAPAPAPAPAPPEVIKVRMISGPSAWSAYRIAVAFADIVNRNTNLEITVESSAGTETVQEGVATQLMEIGGPLSQGSVIAQYEGTRSYEGKPNKDLRGIVGLGIMDITFIARPDSGIKTIADLRGKTIAKFPGESYVFYGPLIETYGLKEGTDYDTINMEGDEVGWDELIMGRIDAMPTYGASNLLKVEEALGSVIFVPLDRENILELKQTNPELLFGVVPTTLQPAFYKSVGLTSVTKPVPQMISPRLLFAHKALSDDLAYTIAKTMVENATEFERVSEAKGYSPDIAVWVPEIPFHPGAVKAFRELGLWTEEMETAQQALLAKE